MVVVKEDRWFWRRSFKLPLPSQEGKRVVVWVDPIDFDPLKEAIEKLIAIAPEGAKVEFRRATPFEFLATTPSGQFWGDLGNETIWGVTTLNGITFEVFVGGVSPQWKPIRNPFK